jgi:centromere protein C
MNAIVRVPKEDPAPLTKVGKKKGPHSGRAGSARAQSRAMSVKNEVPEEEGCDDMTDPDGLVWSWEGNAETTRRASSFSILSIKPC